VLVEIDRCATDAIQSVTGCTLGKRSLKWLDYGIMAATFVNLKNDRAVRVTAREEAREKAAEYCPETSNRAKQQLEAYRLMPEEELFNVQPVRVEIPQEDPPGKPLRRVQCQSCGDWVQDKQWQKVFRWAKRWGWYRPTILPKKMSLGAIIDNAKVYLPDES